jgi:long-chain acyl-CoA synthetase
MDGPRTAAASGARVAPIPGGVQTVAALIEARAATHPDRIALIDGAQRLTYADVEQRSRHWAGALLSSGLVAGDRVAASMANSVDLVMSYLAAMRAGLVWVGVGAALSSDERDHMHRDSGASVLLVSGSAPSSAPSLPSVTSCAAFDVADDPWLRLAAEATDVTLPPIDAFAPAAIAYTSGTTGRPKGVVHSQRNMLLPGVVGASLDQGVGPVGMYLPLTSLNMQVLGPVYAMVNGTACVCIERRDVAGVVEAIGSYGIGRLSAAAATVYDLVVDESFDRDALASLHSLTVGGSSTPDWLVDAYHQRFGKRFLSGYGLTEAPSSVTRELADRAHVAGGSGPALPQFELAMLDDDGRPAPPGHVGEICFRAASVGAFADVYTPMLGYWQQSAASEAALRDGWVHTGDVGRLDGDELLVEDRRIDLIVRGGSNIYPAEVERVLLADRRVDQCAVVARADARLGQLPVAFVQLNGGATMTIDDVLALCARSLAAYKVPVEVRFVANLPRNSMGKVLRDELRALLVAGVSDAAR